MDDIETYKQMVDALNTTTLSSMRQQNMDYADNMRDILLLYKHNNGRTGMVELEHYISLRLISWPYKSGIK